MDRVIACPGCQRTLRFREDCARKLLRCPACWTEFSAPLQDLQALPDAPVPRSAHTQRPRARAPARNRRSSHPGAPANATRRADTAESEPATPRAESPPEEPAPPPSRPASDTEWCGALNGRDRRMP